ncbi:MAG: trehalose-phosphatase [Bdellovibrionaceae bacterium]|nr:trehalose-phosphatase [Pseudobdellovibrionaceae bacterium]
MMPLFSKGSMIVLESLSFTQTLYAFDYDGTLARIVQKPDDAYLTKTTETLLKELSKYAPVAIVSGRGIADMKKRIHFQPQFLVCNRGLEVSDEVTPALDQALDDCNRWKTALNAIKFSSGVELEDKVYSLAIHYRRSRSKKEDLKKIKELVPDLVPAPRVVYGKSVVNLVPAQSPHKGTAVLDLIQRSQMKHIFYIGDDDSDEDVFSLDYNVGQIMTVRVGQKRSSLAKYFIKHQSEINQVLKSIIQFYKRGQP